LPGPGDLRVRSRQGAAVVSSSRPATRASQPGRVRWTAIIWPVSENPDDHPQIRQGPKAECPPPDEGEGPVATPAAATAHSAAKPATPPRTRSLPAGRRRSQTDPPQHLCAETGVHAVRYVPAGEFLPSSPRANLVDVNFVKTMRRKSISECRRHVDLLNVDMARVIATNGIVEILLCDSGGFRESEPNPESRSADR
jgi:hypothetical protein